MPPDSTKQWQKQRTARARGNRNRKRKKPVLDKEIVINFTQRSKLEFKYFFRRVKKNPAASRECGGLHQLLQCHILWQLFEKL